MEKIVFFSITVILYSFFGCKSLMACHEEAASGGYPTLRGHNPTYRQNGILVTFEGSSASISTSANCDAYTHFIKLNYDQIVNNAAKGQGPYLDALASLRGCSDGSRLQFGRVIHANFSKLFQNIELKVKKLNHNLGIIINSEPLLRNKCQILPKSTFS